MDVDSREDGKLATEGTPNQGERVGFRRSPLLSYILLIVFVASVLNLRQSMLLTQNFSLLEKESSGPDWGRTKIQDGRSAAKSDKDRPMQTTTDLEVGESTAANKDNHKNDDGEVVAVEVSKELPATIYSYNTTNLGEFKRLQNEFLLSRQKLLDDSHLSTKARDKDANGNTVSTYALVENRGFAAGFRNQIMMLTMLVIKANYDGHEQLLLDGLLHKDTYGTNRMERFDFFFDVEHWNKYSYNEDRIRGEGIPANTADPERYPNWLPRLVLFDPSIHNDLKNTTSLQYKSKEIAQNATRPYSYQGGKATKLAGMYIRYGKGRGKFVPHPIGKENKPALHTRNPAEILMLQGALRPHPALQAVVDRSKASLLERVYQIGTRNISTPGTTRSSFRYMTLHARVEPDMQKHMMCRDKKVLNLQEIVDMIESHWEDPPVDVVFLPINRQYLEKEGTLPESFTNDTESNEKINWIAVRNLQLLNRLTDHNNSKDGLFECGLWNGRVPVVEFGSEALRGTVYEHRPSISGAILNYFLALDADVFVGTEVSSFSHDVLGARFYRGFNATYTDGQVPIVAGETKNLRKNNFKYLPDGLQEWITNDMHVPPNFLC